MRVGLCLSLLLYTLRPADSDIKPKHVWPPDISEQSGVSEWFEGRDTEVPRFPLPRRGGLRHLLSYSAPYRIPLQLNWSLGALFSFL